MKLTDFLRGLFGTKVDVIKSAVSAVNTEAENKNLTGVFENVSTIVAEGAKIVEEASNSLKDLTGGGIPGTEKHEAVKTLVLDAVAPTLEKNVPAIPGTTSEFMGSFLRTLLGGVVSILINSFVAKANEKNWKF